LASFGIGFDKSKDVIPTHLVMALIVTAIVILLFKLTVKKTAPGSAGERSMISSPNKMQIVVEGYYKFYRDLVDDMIGKEGRKFIPALFTLGTFIAVSNLLGLFPEMGSPTANINVTVGCAIFIFMYYHYQGVKKHGFLGYLKTFLGPVWWLGWLFLPIEIVSHLSRPLSLSMRLFGNIFGEDLVIIIIASLVPFVAPMPVMGLAIFTSLLQAYIFVMLSSIYLAGAIASEH
jgi:F-type H+-transporting ATPase subunit a